MSGFPDDGKSILFISRNYPPQRGGLETYSYHLIRHFERHVDTRKIVLRRPRRHLMWFLPYSFFKALYLSATKTIRSVHLCDAVLAPLGCILKTLTGIKVTVTAHGLDVTYPNRLYQRIVPYCAGKLDLVVCVSRSTRAQCTRRAIPAEKCIVIPNGVDPAFFKGEPSEGRRIAEEIVGGPIGRKKIILHVGRLVKRKGVAWFVSEVMPRLDGTFLLIVAGEGPEYASVKLAVADRGLDDRVFLTGGIDDRTRNHLYRAADMFVMPNMAVPNDVEGFGIAALEAGINGLPVLASDLEGLRDAVIEGRTGYLLKAGFRAGFVNTITALSMNREEVREAVENAYGWERIYRRYEKTLVGRGGQ